MCNLIIFTYFCQRKVAQKQVNNGNAKQPRQVLQELLTAIKIEAEQNMASRGSLFQMTNNKLYAFYIH
jgi:hypothetical protein